MRLSVAFDRDLCHGAEVFSVKHDLVDRVSGILPDLEDLSLAVRNSYSALCQTFADTCYRAAEVLEYSIRSRNGDDGVLMLFFCRIIGRVICSLAGLCSFAAFTGLCVIAGVAACVITCVACAACLIIRNSCSVSVVGQCAYCAEAHREGQTNDQQQGRYLFCTLPFFHFKLFLLLFFLFQYPLSGCPSSGYKV